MQDRYVGDVGDFAKYGLLRAIQPTKRLGVAWYLHPDAGPSGDGSYTTYLQEPEEWRSLDPDLFDTLREVVSSQRSVASIQESGILGDAVFAADRLDLGPVKVKNRADWRCQWFDRVQRHLVGCDLVFADPDNGLFLNECFRPTTKVSAKHIPVSEALALAEGRTAVIYHHNSRYPGGHREEIRWWKSQIPDRTMAYYWRRWSNRTFFIVNPDEGTRQRLLAFADRWRSTRGELV